MAVSTRLFARVFVCHTAHCAARAAHMEHVTMTRASDSRRSLSRRTAHAALWCAAVCCRAFSQDLQPTDLEASAAVTEVVLSWAAGRAAAGLEYEVESCAGAACADFSLAGTTDVTSATDSGLRPGAPPIATACARWMRRATTAPIRPSGRLPPADRKSVV